MPGQNHHTQGMSAGSKHGLWLPVRCIALAATLAGAGCDRELSEAAAVPPDPAPSVTPAVALATPAGPAQPVATAKPHAAEGAPAPTPDKSGSLFTEITGSIGFSEKPDRYPDGTYLTPEITPGGVALFDYDNDGLLDILVIRHPPPGPYPQAFQATAPNRLYRQQPGGTFAEVPGAAGLGGTGFHHGVAVGDANNDGWQDVYVANYGGPDEFFLNGGASGGGASGGGASSSVSFINATKQAGFPTERSPQTEKNWSSTAAFFDYDGDGNLDLFVAHFATFDPTKKCQLSNSAGDLDYCGPHQFPGQLATLYRGHGDGTFADVTGQAGINAPGRGWGLIAADLTGDGLADVLQANDEEPNQLWVNQGDGTFADEAVLRGCAFNAAGSVEANMGIAIGDVHGGGNLDLFITHITSETNTLFRNHGEGAFTDTTAAAGMALIDRPFTGWGCGFFDYDNDGHLDLAVANGRVAKGPARPEAELGPFWNRFAEPNLLFRGNGTGRLVDVSRDAGTFASRLEVTRALAFADLFNRGAVDMVAVNVDNTVRVYRNDAAPADHHWLQVLPMIGKREALGARVTLNIGDQKRVGLCLRSYSYLSSNDPRVHFGLAKQNGVDSVEIEWPSGIPKRERFKVDGVDRVLKVTQGQGEPL